MAAEAAGDTRQMIGTEEVASEEWRVARTKEIPGSAGNDRT
jgi:hypothetical protein